MTVQPTPPPPPPGRRTLGSVRGSKAAASVVRRGTPRTIPTCCGEHRSEVVDLVDWLFAVDLYAELDRRVGEHLSVDDVADEFRERMSNRLRFAVELGRTFWLLKQDLHLADGVGQFRPCPRCGDGVEIGPCWCGQ